MGTRIFRTALLALLSILGAGIAAVPALAAKPPAQPSSLRNPILPLSADGDDSPDPWVFRHNGTYWINYTSNRKIVYRSAAVLGALGSAPERTVWPPEGQVEPAGRSVEVWAPETHKVGGRWYIYYTAKGPNEVDAHRMFVLESKTKSPAGPYEFKAQLELPQPYAIDGTVFQAGGKLYLAYSGGPRFTPTSIYLAELSNPWTVKGTPIMISTPEYGWEKIPVGINEGPEALLHGNKLHIIFSASWCGSGMYALGRVTVPKKANLTDPETWAGAKYPDPVFETDDARGVYGPGHGSFFTSNGGKEYWNVYHATEEAGKGCFTGGSRSTRVQRFTWKEDGSPNFGRPVSLTSDIHAPKGDNTIAVQAESSKFLAPSRVSTLAERRFYGYSGVTLTPAGDRLPAMRFRLRRKARYQVYVRVLGGPEAGRVSLIRPDGHRVTRNAARSESGAIELNMGRMRLGKGLRSLRLRSATPVSLDQIRLQLLPDRKKNKKRR